MPELVRADLVRLEDDVWLDILAWSGPVDPGRIDGAARCTPMTAEMRGLIAAELRAGPRRVAPGLVLGPVTVHDVGGQRRGAALMRAQAARRVLVPRCGDVRRVPGSGGWPSATTPRRRRSTTLSRPLRASYILGDAMGMP